MMRTTHRFILALGMVAILSSTAAAAERPPNILFFLADDLGWMDLGCYGSTFYESPTLDRLARDGIRFTNAYTAGTVCAPTRSSIITGQATARHGCTDWTGKLTDPSSHFTLARALNEGGYQTFHTGKWHVGGTTPEQEGFGLYEELLPSHDAKNDPKKTRQMTNHTLAFLEQINRDRPFFAYVCYHAVHTPLKEREDLVDKYRAKLTTDPPKSRGPKGLEKERDRGNKQVQNVPQFAAMVEGIDISVRRILKSLADKGLDGNTIVIFSSDNGGLSTKGCTSNLPLRAGKGWAYEGGIRVPLIVKWPGQIKPKQTTDVPVVSMDFYPTLLEVAGLPLRPKEHVDGTGLRGLLTAGKAPERDTLYWHYPHYHGGGCIPVGAMREGRYKIVHWFGEERYELYDLETDLSELRDISKEFPELLDRLTKKLTAWQQSIPDIKYDNPNGWGRKKRKKKTE
jgi:arylsulfatase A-like enzyme